MPKLSPIDYRKVTKKLRKAGFVMIRQGKGSYEIRKHPVTGRKQQPLRITAGRISQSGL